MKLWDSSDLQYFVPQLRNGRLTNGRQITQPKLITDREFEASLYPGLQFGWVDLPSLLFVIRGAT